ncbi:Conserved oligomeric Golgi complex subunit [Echinococcus granulosus]|uniref:Conserved oligomeric Golgi complex subunit 8 n=1 Tax=Echinococcus granulosus TaxID=6210 RepID=W6US05_ECHGR|nr:Conserved oligomeric Golgi complex subunit [Echinococcus granulosus]EUB64028.1 Conserved oligomeric Golgi complex subunit [Echinococcus granulosus]
MGEDSVTDLSNFDAKVEVEKLIQMLLLSSEVESSVSADPQFADCISKLSHLRLDELAATPKRIQMEEDSIRYKTEQLAVENYPIFLANANTSRDVHREFLSISESNVNLLASIAGVSSAAQTIFDNIGKNASAFRVSAKFVQKYTQVGTTFCVSYLYFLELPQLMDTCIRNGYCQDALNILSHTKRMTKKYGRTVPIVRMVGLQAQEISGQLFSQLCKQLREPVTLPVCLKVVIYLRQFEAFTEQELRLNFLQARAICIKDQLEFALTKPIGLSSFDSSSATKSAHISGHQQAEYRAFIRAMRRIEVTRVQLFDSITQYRAVFADEEAYSSKLTDPHQQPVLADISPLHIDETALTLRGLATNGIDYLGPSTEASLFHSWLVHQVGIFLDGLNGDLNTLLSLPHFTPSEISDRIRLAMANDSITLDSVDAPTTFQQIHSVMTQALYFGRSFARIGCDFRAHLGAIFSRATLNYFEALLTNALIELSATLELWPWELSELPFMTNQPESTSPDEFSAPMAIALHPPIAFFCNRLLTAFNGLCICCSVGLRDGVLSASIRILSGAAEAIVAAHRSRQLDSAAARAQSSNLASVFAHVAVPHLLSCLLEYIFGGDAVAHLWQLRLEGEEEVPSTSQTVSLLARRVCAPIFVVWGQLSTGPLRAGDTVKQSVIPDTDEVRPTSDAHASLLTTALEKRQPSQFQHGEPKALASLTEESNDLSIAKGAPHSLELSLLQKEEVEFESKAIAAHSAGFAPVFEVEKNESEVLEKPNPSILAKNEVGWEVASSHPENDGPSVVPEDLKTARLDSSALELVEPSLSSTEKCTIRGTDAHLASMQKSKPEAVSSTLLPTEVEGWNSHLGIWPHEEAREEAAPCQMTEPNQEEVSHDDVEAPPKSPVSLSTHEPRMKNFTAPELTVPPVTKATVKDSQEDKEGKEVNEESAAVLSSKVASTAIEESGQQDVETRAEIESIDRLSLDAYRSAETMTIDGNTTAENRFNNHYSTLLEIGDQSDNDTALQPYHPYSLLRKNQPSMEDGKKCVQSSSTSHNSAANSSEASMVKLELTLPNDIPGDKHFLSVQKTPSFVEEGDSFPTDSKGEGLPSVPKSPSLKGAFLEQPKLGLTDPPTEKEGVFGGLQQGFDILDNREPQPSMKDNGISPSHELISPPSVKKSENDDNNSSILSVLDDNANELKTPATVSVPPMITTCPTSVSRVSETLNEPADWNDEKNDGDDGNLIGHSTTNKKVCVSAASNEQDIDIQANHEFLFPTSDQTNFSNQEVTTVLSVKEESASKDDSISLSDLGGDDAGELSASAEISVPAMVTSCPTSTLGRPDADNGLANWIDGDVGGEASDSRNAEPVDVNNQKAEYLEEEFAINKDDKVLTNIDDSIVNKPEEREMDGTVATDMQSPVVEQAVNKGSGEELVEAVNIGARDVGRPIALYSSDLDTSPQSRLIEDNNGKELSADSGFEVNAKLSVNENVDVAGIGDLGESAIVDQKVEAVGTVGDEFANWKGGWEADTDPSDFASLQNLEIDVQSMAKTDSPANNSKEESSDVANPDGTPTNPDTEVLLPSGTIASHTTRATDLDETGRSETSPEKLASFNADWSEGDNAWGGDADTNINDEEKPNLHTDDKPVEPDSNLIQRNAEGELETARSSEIDANVSANEPRDWDLYGNSPPTKKIDSEGLEEEIKAQTPTSSNEWKTEVERVEGNEPLFEEQAINAGTSAEKLLEEGQSPLSAKPANNADLGEDETTWAEDADISVNVTQEHHDLRRFRSDSALPGNTYCEKEDLPTTNIPSAPPFSNAYISQSKTAYFSRTVVDRQEKQLAVGGTVASTPRIILESSSVHPEPSEVQAVDADQSKAVNDNFEDSSKSPDEAKVDDVGNNEAVKLVQKVNGSQRPLEQWTLLPALRVECMQAEVLLEEFDLFLCHCSLREEVPHGEDLQSPEIQTLVMSQLPEGTWLSLEEPQLASSGIQKIEVQRSFIDKVETGYFAKVGGKNKLKRLTLRNVQGSAVVDKNMLQGLEKSLNYLVVANGLTVNIADLTEMEYLTDLGLMSTKIVGTPADFEKLLPRLRSLEIKKCHLLQLPWEALAKWLTESDSRRLKINDNDWNCDCSMVKLKHLHPGVVENELQRLKCASPPNLAGKQLSELTDKDLCPEGEPDMKQGGGEDSLKASSSTSEDGGDKSGSGSDSSPADLGPSSGHQAEDGRARSSAMRTEVIIGGTVVGALVVAFIVFIIIYKCRLYPEKKNREERTSRTHQNKRYVNVIEEPPLQQYGNNSRGKENGKFAEGAPV